MVSVSYENRSINPSYVVADGEENMRTSPLSPCPTRFSPFPLTLCEAVPFRVSRSSQISECVTSVNLIVFNWQALFAHHLDICIL
jgi:hypothetical protein